MSFCRGSFMSLPSGHGLVTEDSLQFVAGFFHCAVGPSRRMHVQEHERAARRLSFVRGGVSFRAAPLPHNRHDNPKCERCQQRASHSQQCKADIFHGAPFHAANSSEECMPQNGTSIIMIWIPNSVHVCHSGISFRSPPVATLSEDVRRITSAPRLLSVIRHPITR